MYALNVVVVASVALVVAVNASAHRTLQAVDFRDDIEEAINAARKAKGLSKLCINNKLMDAAQTQANDMAENNLVKTTGSDKSSLKDRALAHGFKGEVVTEVVAAGYRTAVSVVDAWSKSQTALETIFSPTITVLGPGYAFDKTKKFIHFWAVDFSTGGCGDSESSDPIPKNTDNQESDASASVDDATAPSSEAEEEKTSVVTPITDPDDASTNPDKPAVVTAAAPAGNEEETTENPPPSNGVDDAATPDVADDSGNEDISDASPAPGAPAPLNSNAPELEVPTSDASDSEASPIPASDAPESEGPALDASELEASPIPASDAPELEVSTLDASDLEASPIPASNAPVPPSV